MYYLGISCRLARHVDICRENMDKQLFLLNSSLNNTILRTRDECVLVWELQLLGIQLGKVYSLQELQASYKAAVKVLDIHPTIQSLESIVSCCKTLLCCTHLLVYSWAAVAHHWKEVKTEVLTWKA